MNIAKLIAYLQTLPSTTAVAVGGNGVLFRLTLDDFTLRSTPGWVSENTLVVGLFIPSATQEVLHQPEPS